MIKLIYLSALTFLFATSSIFAANSSTSSHNNVSQTAVQLSDNRQRTSDGNKDHSAQSFIDQGKISSGQNHGEQKAWHKKHHKHYQHHDFNGDYTHAYH